MKYSYGRRSLRKLATASFGLQLVFDEALAMGLIDITIIEGRRNKQRQNRFYANKKSKLRWPNSKHNVLKPDDLAHAVDAAPYVNGKASDNWYPCMFMAGVVLACGEKLGIPIRWGGCWSGNPADIGNQKFEDLWHYEEVLK